MAKQIYYITKDPLIVTWLNFELKLEHDKHLTPEQTLETYFDLPEIFDLRT